MSEKHTEELVAMLKELEEILEGWKFNLNTPAAQDALRAFQTRKTALLERIEDERKRLDS